MVLDLDIANRIDNMRDIFYMTSNVGGKFSNVFFSDPAQWFTVQNLIETRVNFKQIFFGKDFHEKQNRTKEKQKQKQKQKKDKETNKQRKLTCTPPQTQDH